MPHAQSLTDVDIAKLEERRSYAEAKTSRRADDGAGLNRRITGTLAIRYRAGSGGLMAGVTVEEWSRINAAITDAGFSGFVGVVGKDEIAIINLAEVACLAFRQGRSEDQS